MRAIISVPQDFRVFCMSLGFVAVLLPFFERLTYRGSESLVRKSFFIISNLPVTIKASAPRVVSSCSLTKILVHSWTTDLKTYVLPLFFCSLFCFRCRSRTCPGGRFALGRILLAPPALPVPDTTPTVAAVAVVYHAASPST